MLVYGFVNIEKNKLMNAVKKISEFINGNMEQTLLFEKKIRLLEEKTFPFNLK